MLAKACCKVVFKSVEIPEAIVFIGSLLLSTIVLNDKVNRMLL